jgi:hypothetical protein
MKQQLPGKYQWMTEYLLENYHDQKIEKQEDKVL